MGPHHLMDLVLLTLSAFIEKKLYLPNELAIIIKLISTSMNNLEHTHVKQCVYVKDSLHKILMTMMTHYRVEKLSGNRIPLGRYLSSFRKIV